jgi:hypothetical protein
MLSSYLLLVGVGEGVGAGFSLGLWSSICNSEVIISVVYWLLMSNSLFVRFIKLIDDVYMSIYVIDGFAVLDFYVCDCEAIYFVGEGWLYTILIGIVIEILEGHAMLLFS